MERAEKQLIHIFHEGYEHAEHNGEDTAVCHGSRIPGFAIVTRPATRACAGVIHHTIGTCTPILTWAGITWERCSF